MIHRRPFNFFVFIASLISFLISPSLSNSASAIEGSWLAEIKMGESIFRLVFHINLDENGNLVGTIDSPDKGIKGIPLSQVITTNDSVKFEISAAQASFIGKLSNDNNSIVGKWQEGENSFSVTLKRTKEIIETKQSDEINSIPDFLDFYLSSKHFELYSSKSDSSILNDLSKVLEKNYMRITKNLKTKFSKKISVLIYPNIESFHEAIFLPNAPDWTVGAAGINELKMVSPSNPGSIHTYESLMLAIVHELVHTTVLNIRKAKGLVGLPKWLNEGYAFYEASQMTENMRKTVKSNSQKNPLTWAQLNRANTTVFGEINGYAVSTSIIEFLIQRYGLDNLIELIISPENIEAIYGLSKKQLEKQWLQYLSNTI